MPICALEPDKKKFVSGYSREQKDKKGEGEFCDDGVKMCFVSQLCA